MFFHVNLLISNILLYKFIINFKVNKFKPKKNYSRSFFFYNNNFSILESKINCILIIFFKKFNENKKKSIIL